MGKQLLNTATNQIEDNVLDQKLSPEDFGGTNDTDWISTKTIEEQDAFVGGGDAIDLSNVDTEYVESMDQSTEGLAGNIAADSQGTMSKIGNALAAGVSKGAVGVLDPFAMASSWALEGMGMHDAADAIDGFSTGLKADLGEIFQAHDYKVDPNGSIIDNFTQFSTLESIVSSATQFGMLGIGSAATVGKLGTMATKYGVALGKAAEAGKIAKNASKALMETGRVLNNGVSVLGTGIESNTLARAALSNTMEGMIMADEVGKTLENTYSKLLYDPTLSDEAKQVIKDKISSAKKNMYFQNMTMMMTDYIGFSKFMPNSVNAKSLLKNIGKAGAVVSPMEGFEEFTQSLIQQNAELNAQFNIEEGYAALDDEYKLDGVEGVSAPFYKGSDTLLGVKDPKKADEIARQNGLVFGQRLYEQMSKTSTWVETLSGIFGGGPQFMITGAPRYFSSRKVRAEQKRKAVEFSTSTDNMFNALAAQDLTNEVALDALVKDSEEYLPDGTDASVMREVVEDYAVTQRAVEALINNGADGAFDFISDSNAQLNDKYKAEEITKEEYDKYINRLDALEAKINKYKNLGTYINGTDLLKAQAKYDLLESIEKALNKGNKLVWSDADAEITDKAENIEADVNGAVSAEESVDAKIETTGDVGKLTPEKIDAAVEGGEVNTETEVVEGSPVADPGVSAENVAQEVDATDTASKATSSKDESYKALQRAKEALYNSELDNIPDGADGTTISEETSEATGQGKKGNKALSRNDLLKKIAKDKEAALKSLQDGKSHAGQIAAYQKRDILKGHQVQVDKITRTKNSGDLHNIINNLVESLDNETDSFKKSLIADQLRTAHNVLTDLVNVDNESTTPIKKKAGKKAKNHVEKQKESEEAPAFNTDQVAESVLSFIKDKNIPISEEAVYMLLDNLDIDESMHDTILDKVMELERTPTPDGVVSGVETAPIDAIIGRASDSNAVPLSGNPLKDQPLLESILIDTHPDLVEDGYVSDNLEELSIAYTSAFEDASGNGSKAGLKVKQEGEIVAQTTKLVADNVQVDVNEVGEELKFVQAHVTKNLAKGETADQESDSSKMTTFNNNMNIVNTMMEAINFYNKIRQNNNLPESIPSFDNVVHILKATGIDVEGYNDALKYLYANLTGGKFGDVASKGKKIQEYDDAGDKYFMEPEYKGEVLELTVESEDIIADAIAHDGDTMENFKLVKEGVALTFKVLSDEEISKGEDFDVWTGDNENDLKLHKSWSDFKSSPESKQVKYNDLRMRPIAVYTSTPTGSVRIGFVHTGQFTSLNKNKQKMSAKTKAQIVNNNMKIRAAVINSKDGEVKGKLTSRKSNIRFTDRFVAGIAINSKKIEGKDDYFQTDVRFSEVFANQDSMPVFAIVQDEGTVHEEFVKLAKEKGINEIKVPEVLEPGSTVVIVPLEDSGKGVAIKLINRQVPANALEALTNRFFKIAESKVTRSEHPSYINKMFDNVIGSFEDLSSKKSMLKTNVSVNKETKTVVIGFKLGDNYQRIVLNYEATAQGENEFPVYTYKIANKDEYASAKEFIQNLILAAKRGDDSGMPYYNITKENLVAAQSGLNEKISVLTKKSGELNDNASDYKMGKTGYLETMIGANTLTHLAPPKNLGGGVYSYTTNTIVNFELDAKPDGPTNNVEGTGHNANVTDKKSQQASLERKKSQVDKAIKGLNVLSKNKVTYSSLLSLINKVSKNYLGLEAVTKEEKNATTVKAVLGTMNELLGAKDEFNTAVDAKITNEDDRKEAREDFKLLNKEAKKLLPNISGLNKINVLARKLGIGYSGDFVRDLRIQPAKVILELTANFEKLASELGTQIKAVQPKSTKILSGESFEDFDMNESDFDFDMDFEDDSEMESIEIQGRKVEYMGTTSNILFNSANDSKLITFTDEDNKLC